ncbi:endonuclease/exonuclease/phosphatase family protein [Thalassoglobus polymorphus]|uniref:Endonuclease/exonuclease/phosphatase domain-containing protein n=1 Tax=Thalassoglobus polymorphus TaxID=2527994 RepID=A0A517QUY8_9PLAN|nr:endonuclease/exonuclease/phosphatase family protein [Thalassoglobus polymorphus]QDT35452.1 hypothetical protein Mal48_47290 [Thalassoglobus polymorphus]
MNITGNDDHRQSRPLLKMAIRGGVLLSAATVLSLFAQHFWMFDLLTSFHVQYSLALILVVGLLLRHRRWTFSALAGVALGYNLLLVLPVYLPVQQPLQQASQQPSSEGRSLRLVSANVQTSNRDHAEFLKWIRKEDPDLFLVMEVDDRWMASLRELKEEYRHSVSFARSDNFGIALFSKLPMNAEIVHIGVRELPSVLARVQVDHQVVTLVGTHPLPPGGKKLSGWRNQQLEAVSEVVGRIDGPKILLGDLNVTPWSPYFKDVLESTGLRDSRAGFGIQPTWPATNPLFWIPIDHVLTSDEVQVHEREIGSNNGSDHYPVVVDFSIAQD